MGNAQPCSWCACMVRRLAGVYGRSMSNISYCVQFRANTAQATVFLSASLYFSIFSVSLSYYPSLSLSLPCSGTTISLFRAITEMFNKSEKHKYRQLVKLEYKTVNYYSNTEVNKNIRPSHVCIIIFTRGLQGEHKSEMVV